MKTSQRKNGESAVGQPVAETPPPAANAMTNAADFKNHFLKQVPALRGFARVLCGQSALGDDLTQETLLRAWASKETFTRGTNMRAWLFTILRNVFYTHMRRQALETAVCNDPQFSKTSVGPRQHTSLEVKELLNAFPQLPPEQREAMFLIVAEGLSYEQAASICGCAVGTIKSRIGRARKALQTEFEGNQPERRTPRVRTRIRHAPAARPQQHQAEAPRTESDE